MMGVDVLPTPRHRVVLTKHNEGDIFVPRVLFLSALALSLSCLVPEVSFAAPESQDAEYTYGVEVETAFPVQVGIGVHLETDQRIRLHTHFGFFPESYLQTINDAAEAVDFYDETTSNLIEAALKNSLVWRLGIAWQPWADYGFFFGGGYMLAFLGGGLSGAETLEAVTGRNLENTRASERSFDVETSVHFAEVELGWGWHFDEHLYLRLGLGGSFTLASNTAVSPSWTPSPLAAPSVDAISSETETYLDDTFQNYVHTASVNVAVGWTF